MVYLQEANVVAGDRLDQVLRRRDLAKGHLEMVGIWQPSACPPGPYKRPRLFPRTQRGIPYRMFIKSRWNGCWSVKTGKLATMAPNFSLHVSCVNLGAGVSAGFGNVSSPSSVDTGCSRALGCQGGNTDLTLRV